ncbi:MAG: hypothetical protein J6S85_16725 [Methanobrevibacter sp.]|nr:hypothetical protein [Methanobrevibacter sp.]
MSKGLEALENHKLVLKALGYKNCEEWENLKDIEKELEALEIIEENLKYGYVFIGYDKDNKPLFQFADTKLYEEIKKNITY